MRLDMLFSKNPSSVIRENIIYEVRKNSLVGDLPQMLADRYTYFLYWTELGGKKIGLA